MTADEIDRLIDAAIMEGRVGQLGPGPYDLPKRKALRAAVERVIAESAKLRDSAEGWRALCESTELTRDNEVIRAERAEKEADSYKKTAARLANDNLDLRRALKEIRDATHTNAVTLRGMADMALK